MTELAESHKNKQELIVSLGSYFSVPLDKRHASEGQLYAEKLLPDLLVSLEALGGMLDRSCVKPDSVDFMFALDSLAMVSKRLKCNWLNKEVMMLYDCRYETSLERRKASIEHFLDQIQMLRTAQ